MTILLYHCPTAPAKRRWIAQSQNPNLTYITIHGETADIARAKANIMDAYSRLQPADRKAFDLKGKLAELSGAVSAEEDELL